MTKSQFYKLCILRHIISTIYFNIHYLGWKKGWRLPIVFLSPIKLRELKGSILINHPIEYAMISIGIPGNEMFDYNTPCIWCNQGGVVEFDGSFGTNPGASFVIRKDARLVLGEHSSFGQNLRILCSNQISIGSELLGSWDVTIMDTDSHQFENTQTNEISTNSKAISIGDHCFIGNGVTILKGTEVPDNSVIAAKAVVAKPLPEPSSLYAGTPAVLVKRNLRYVK